jgi:DNA-binding NtrC family response regulator
MQDAPEVLRVLVVDDQAATSNRLCLTLRANGYQARSAPSAEQALTIASQFRPHVLIAEVVLPGRSGIELASTFAQRYPACKVLLVSGHDSAFVLAERASRKGHTYKILPKPVQASQILAFVAGCTPHAPVPAALNVPSSFSPGEG